MTEPLRRLLHIEGSPRGSRSRSSAIARRVIQGLGLIEAETLNLFDANLPAFDGAAIEGRYALIAGEAVPPQMAVDWAAIDAMVKHLLSFDIWLLNVPMWNFGVPYRLKHYIDLVTQPGMTFTVDAEGQIAGLAAGRTVILIGSGALDVRAGGPLAALDHQMSFLRTWLGFIGVTDIRTIELRPTFGDPAAIEETMQVALVEADRLAAGLVPS